MCSRVAILVVFTIQLSSQTNIVWENLEDICYYNRSEVNSAGHVKGRCELVPGVQVQKRFYKDYHYWCIAVDTGVEVAVEDFSYTDTNILPIAADFLRNRTLTEHHKTNIEYDCYTYTIYRGDRELVVTMRADNKLVSLVIDGLESCDQNRLDECDAVKPNQKNKNPLKYFEKCVELNSVRKAVSYSPCQVLDAVNTFEYIMNGDTVFTCITINKTFAPHKYNETALELYLYVGGNFTVRWSNLGNTLLANSVKCADCGIDGFLFNVQDSVVISIESKFVNAYDYWIEHIIVNKEDACRPFHQNDICGVVYKNYRPFSLFALPTNPGQYPWHVAIYKHTNGTKTHICDGTLIESYGILTAAHCLYENSKILPANRISMELAKFDMRLSSYYTQVIMNFIRIVIHDGFDSDTLDNDIALVVFSDIIDKNEYIEKICYIPLNKGLLKQTYGFVPSWANSGEYEHILGEAKIIFDLDEPPCAVTNKLCGRYDFNETSACVRDGGGLVVEFLTDWFLYGIVSKRRTSTEDCQHDEQVDFTQVDKYVDWIGRQYDLSFQLNCNCSI